MTRRDLRPGTIPVSAELQRLYEAKSKHSSYQSLPTQLVRLFGSSAEISEAGRSEKARLDYILPRIDLYGKNVLDIGGNTGYFTFEAIEHGARNVKYYEGNSEHALFVKTAASHLDLSGKLDVINEYFTFGSRVLNGNVNICFCLNVVHHLGDDFGDPDVDKKTAKSLMLESINALADDCEYLAFQMGFNWKGDVELPLFDRGTKVEVIEFVKTGIQGNFDILNCGVATGDRSGVVYKEISEQNSDRNDDLGEFLNRPIFILKSNRYIPYEL